jgi:hypothetical protein
MFLPMMFDYCIMSHDFAAVAGLGLHAFEVVLDPED